MESLDSNLLMEAAPSSPSCTSSSLASPADPSTANPSYTFYLGGGGFSIYEAMALAMKKIKPPPVAAASPSIPPTDEPANCEDSTKKKSSPSIWKQVKTKTRMHTCDVVLGDRFEIPYHLLREGSKPLLINYFKGSSTLTLKASMARTLRANAANSKDWMPMTFILGGKEADKSEMKLLTDHQSKEPETIWIVKPSAGCKGEGMLISQDIKEIEEFVQQGGSDGNGGGQEVPTTPSLSRFNSNVSSRDGSAPTSPATPSLGGSGAKKPLFVAQKYIDRPLLLSRGRKFDVRVWALLSYPFDIYYFKEGSCRTASTPYDSSNLKEVHSHLTNHCLQESSADFGKEEEGNEMWFSQLDQYLKETKGIDKAVATIIEPQFKAILKDSLLSIKEMIEVPESERYRCFQLFGYDFILDEDLKVHLLEINGSPGSADKWLGPIVDGLINICVEPKFPRNGTTTATPDDANTEIGQSSAPCTASSPDDYTRYWDKVYPAEVAPATTTT